MRSPTQRLFKIPPPVALIHSHNVLVQKRSVSQVDIRIFASGNTIKNMNESSENQCHFRKTLVENMVESMDHSSTIHLSLFFLSLERKSIDRVSKEQLLIP